MEWCFFDFFRYPLTSFFFFLSIYVGWLNEQQGCCTYNNLTMLVMIRTWNHVMLILLFASLVKCVCCVLCACNKYRISSLRLWSDSAFDMLVFSCSCLLVCLVVSICDFIYLIFLQFFVRLKSDFIFTSSSMPSSLYTSALNRNILFPSNEVELLKGLNIMTKLSSLEKYSTWSIFVNCNAWGSINWKWDLLRFVL